MKNLLQNDEVIQNFEVWAGVEKRGQEWKNTLFVTSSTTSDAKFWNLIGVFETRLTNQHMDKFSVKTLPNEGDSSV